MLYVWPVKFKECTNKTEEKSAVTQTLVNGLILLCRNALVLIG